MQPLELAFYIKLLEKIYGFKDRPDIDLDE